jgi:xylan 1,4-beta-xylosidase
MGLGRELADVEAGFALMKRFPSFAKLPVILSEADPEGCAACSAKVNPANAYRNGTLYPAYTAAAYKRLFDLADRYDIDLISMLSWSFEFENHDYFEGFRSLSTNGIDKPILNFFRMAGKLRSQRVVSAGPAGSATDIDAFATADGKGAAILLWNYDDDAAPGPALPAAVTVSGVPDRVRLTHYRIDDTHSNAYTVWQAMGSPQKPSPAQLAELKSKAGLETLEPPRWLTAAGGKLTIETEMPRQSVSLLQLDWQ